MLSDFFDISIRRDNYEFVQRGYFPRTKFKNSPRIEARPWRCYKFEVEDSLPLDGVGFKYLYVPRNIEYNGVQQEHIIKLSSEPFNNELLKLNTTDEIEVLDFVEEYGLVFSPFYQSKERFLSGQYASRKKPFPTDGFATYFENETKYGYKFPSENLVSFVQDRPDSDYIHAFIQQHLIRNDLLTFVDKRSKYINGPDDILWGCYASEFARHNCYAIDPKHEQYGGIVSLPEIQTTLRLYQMMFSLVAFSEYTKNPDANISHRDVIDYFNNPKYVNQNGKKYFFVDLESDGQQRDIAYPSETDIQEIAQSLINKDWFDDEKNALESARIFAETRLENNIQAAFNNARGFFYIASMYVLNQERSVFAYPMFSRTTRTEEVQRTIAQWVSGSSAEEDAYNNDEAGSLDEALFALFTYELQEDSYWNRCKYCGRVFKYSKETNLITSRSLRVGRFCRHSCSVMGSRKKKS